MEKKLREYTRCKACRKKIVFLLNQYDHKVPVDYDTVKEGDTRYTLIDHTIHFSTCTNPDYFRKKPKKAPDKNIYSTAKEIERDRKQMFADHEEKVSKDKRKFIVHNQLPITIPRYAMLNLCFKNGLGYDELISWDYKKLWDWWAVKYEELKLMPAEEPVLFVQ